MHFTREDQLTFLVNDFGQKSHLKFASAVPLELPFPWLPEADGGGYWFSGWWYGCPLFDMYVSIYKPCSLCPSIAKGYDTSSAVVRLYSRW